MPSAPGNVPKYSSNDRFSCMTMTTCWILSIPVNDADALRTPDELQTTKLPTIAASNNAAEP
jgi:hypothetical protein